MLKILSYAQKNLFLHINEESLALSHLRRINGVEKLIPNLYYKRKYTVHIRALKQALDRGLVLERIQRCIEFTQSPWIKEYIDFNTRLRIAACNDFEKDFYKLMNNSVFGKTMENLRRHRDIKLVNNQRITLRQSCILTSNLEHYSDLT